MIVKAIFSILFISLTFAEIGSGNTEEMNLSTTFSFDFYRSVFKVKKNIVLCPMSVRYILALLYQASTGEAEMELKEKINLGTKSETLLEHRKILKKYKNDPNLKFINKIWIKEEVATQIKETFKTVAFNYSTEIEGVNFSNKIKTLNFINKWISQQTNKTIQRIISTDDLDERTEMLIINSVLFNAGWNEPFAFSDFFSKRFRGVHVNMMTAERKFYYANIETLESQVLEIPCTIGTLYSFWIILPYSNSSITRVKDLLTYDMLQDIDNSLQRTEIYLMFPSFNITTTIDAEEVLKSLGIKSLFEKSELGILQGNTTDLKLNSLKQNITLRIDLNGTEGNYTPVPENEEDSSENSKEYTEFCCDRPFIFLIVTQAIEKEVVFIGHYVKP